MTAKHISGKCFDIGTAHFENMLDAALLQNVCTRKKAMALRLRFKIKIFGLNYDVVCELLNVAIGGMYLRELFRGFACFGVDFEGQ